MTTIEAQKDYDAKYRAWLQARKDGANVAKVTGLYNQAKKAQVVLNESLAGDK